MQKLRAKKCNADFEKHKWTTSAKTRDWKIWSCWNIHRSFSRSIFCRPWGRSTFGWLRSFCGYSADHNGIVLIAALLSNQKFNGSQKMTKPLSLTDPLSKNFFVQFLILFFIVHQNEPIEIKPNFSLIFVGKMKPEQLEFFNANNECIFQ